MSPTPTENRVRWFHEARYGMFIHWGVYSVIGRGEWVMNRQRIGVEEYMTRYAAHWQAEHYDPDAWVELARAAGMRYMVLTARHHDGFALWDTATTPHNAARMGPRRDLVRPFVDACRRGGLKVGLYLSPASWSCPDYPGAYYRDWPQQTDWASEEARQRFVAMYHAQLRELMSNYGRIDLLWWDGCVPGNIDGAAANQLALELQPDILITARNGPPFDIAISEQTINPKVGASAWEACMTLNDNWGYHASDNRWKDAHAVIRMLIATAARRGNLLLNVGPRPDGTIPQPSQHILRDVGRWLSRNEAAIRNTDDSPFSWNNMSLATVKGQRVYLHLMYQALGSYCWAELANRVLAARFLATGQSIPFRQEGPRLLLEPLPDPLPDEPVTVIELEVEGKPQPLTSQTTFWIPD